MLVGIQVACMALIIQVLSWKRPELGEKQNDSWQERKKLLEYSSNLDYHFLKIQLSISYAEHVKSQMNQERFFTSNKGEDIIYMKDRKRSI